MVVSCSMSHEPLPKCRPVGHGPQTMFVWMVSVMLGRFYLTAASLRHLFIHQLVSDWLPRPVWRKYIWPKTRYCGSVVQPLPDALWLHMTSSEHDGSTYINNSICVSAHAQMQGAIKSSLEARAHVFTRFYVFTETTADSESFMLELEKLCTVKRWRASLFVSPAASRQKWGGLESRPGCHVPIDTDRRCVSIVRRQTAALIFFLIL